MRFDFEFDAGMRHTRPPLRSIWDHVALRASFRRHPVLSRNSAIRQTGRFSSVRSTCSSRSSSAPSR